MIADLIVSARLSLTDAVTHHALCRTVSDRDPGCMDAWTRTAWAALEVGRLRHLIHTAQKEASQ